MRQKLRRDVASYEDKNLPEAERGRSPGMDESAEVDIDNWRPGLDDIPITAQLTRANKEKLAKRDEEIAIQAEKLSFEPTATTHSSEEVPNRTRAPTAILHRTVSGLSLKYRLTALLTRTV